MERWVDPVPGLKRQLADEVLRLSHGWSQQWAAHAMYMPRSRVSDLRRGRLDTVSLERLVLALSRMGYRTEFTLIREPPKRGRLG